MEQEKNITEEKPRARRDGLMKLEKEAQELWETKNFHHAEIDLNKKKYFATFPYPYTNGYLHLGHAYSLTKAEFMIRFKRLTGHNVLFSQGFHCTGQPIFSSAKKLANELKEYGNPPKFPPMELFDKKTNLPILDEKTKQPKKRSLFQYEILQKINIKPEDIPQFTDPLKWLSFFPPLGQKHLGQFGLHADWRRTFITTEANPFYNSFIEWQFTHLKEEGKIKFGKRPSVYSIQDQQMCADHDRKEGEGVNPQEYILIKQKLLKPYPKSLSHLENRDIFLVPGTLRAETMYGQTNCFVLPTGQYGAFEMKNNEIFICSERSAKNMSYQDITKTDKIVEKVADIMGQELIGCAIKAPLAQFEKVYVWPMPSISMEKGTGIVTSVPSDAPDDYATLRDLQNKKEYRQKCGLTDEQVLPFNPIEIIEIPSYGKLSAIKACEEFKVKSQNDKQQLLLAKEKTYKLGFYEGIMLVDKYKGMKVEDAKPLVKKDLISQSLALVYYEPENLVVSRSGDECIVAYVDQWYLGYNDPDWKKLVHTHTDDKTKFQCYNETTQNLVNITVDWLMEWGCSRSYGLGTKLPWDQQFLIESLSDSTIYMAYYTVCHLLQGNIFGTEIGPLGIKVEEMVRECWDYVFLKAPFDATKMKVSEDKLKKLKEQFEYWYPVNLRVSGKDLIKNHLTMCLFNHAAIWKNQPQLWPKSFFCNGWVLVNGEKMAKSTGNFYTIEDCANKFGIDATRFALANAGDSLDDSNFTFENTDTAILRLSTLEMFIKEAVKNINNFRPKEEKVNEFTNFFDNVFESQLKTNFEAAKNAYENMRHRDVLKYGFFDFTSLKDEYKINLKGVPMRRDLIQLYIELQLLILYPISPHFAEMIYHKEVYPFIKGNTTMQSEYISYCTMPEFTKESINSVYLKKYQYITSLLRNCRTSQEKLKKIQSKAKGKDQNAEQTIKNNVYIVICQEYFQWQKDVLHILSEAQYEGEGENLKIITDWKDKIKAKDNLKQFMKQCFAFAQKTLDEMKVEGKDILKSEQLFDEKQFILQFKDYIASQLSIAQIEIIPYDEAAKSANKEIKKVSTSVLPGSPSIIFY